jgi:hypothetical protein
MASASEFSAQKIYIGPEIPARVDASELTLDEKAIPFSGTLACVGPAFFGMPTNLGFARGVVNVGPSLPPFSATIPGLSLDVTGATHHNGLVNNFGLSNHIGSTNHIGAAFSLGAIMDIGVSTRVGASAAVGGEINAQPNQNDSAVYMTSAAPFYQHFGNMNVAGAFSASTKAFEIDHPTKPGMKLRYGSLEGPENGVYTRGTVTVDGIIELPDYWSKLVDPASLTVQLTSIGVYQELYVDHIEWGQKIVIRNSSGGKINAYYFVQGERIDVDKLVVEFQA